MVKRLAFAFSLVALLFVRAMNVRAQIYFPRPSSPYPYPPRPRPDFDADLAPVEFGSYVAVGGGKVAVGAAGLYGQWNRMGFCPGVDLRVQGNSNYLHGALVGPRLTYKASGRLRTFRPYIEAPFGPNEYPRASTRSAPHPAAYRGVTRAAVFGLDGDLGPHLRFRLVEFSRESFTGPSGANPYTLTTGIVLHLP